MAPSPARTVSAALYGALILLAGALPAAAGAAPDTAPDGLRLTPPQGQVRIFDWSWLDNGSHRDTRVPGPVAGDPSFVLHNFTPRMTGLALSLPGASGPSGFGEKGSGAGFDYSAGAIGGAEVSVTIGSGFTSRKGASLDITEPVIYDTAGLGGRVKISHISLGSAFFNTRATDFTTGARNSVGTGYDLDLSYSFEAGSLSLQRFVGVGEEVLGEQPRRSHESVALTGRYLVGPGLDMTTWLGYGDAGTAGAAQSEVDGWALLTGFHLSF